MPEDDYTLMSSKDVSELKQDVEYLKKNPLGGSKESRTLLQSIERLNDSISQLIEIFKEAGEQVKAEERESDVIVRRIEPIGKQLAELSEQNQKIAKGILAVADMVGQREERPRALPPMGMPMPMPRPMPRPMTPIPKPMPRLPPTGAPLPPGLPVPKKEEKKGFFGMLKKK